MRAEEAAEKRAAKSAEHAVKATAKAAKAEEIAWRKVAQELAKALEVCIYCLVILMDFLTTLL
jgi:hypothetical protein